MAETESILKFFGDVQWRLRDFGEKADDAPTINAQVVQDERTCKSTQYQVKVFSAASPVPLHRALQPLSLNLETLTSD
jgi:hypothetical protein